MPYRLILLALVFTPFVFLAYAPAPASDGPVLAPADTTRHENLQVFPADIPHERLIGAMRGFTRALGVQCDHCHVRGEDGEMDFPSDANPHKEVARAMMRMNVQLNTELLASIDGLHEVEGFRVTCWTCHRGEATPATMWPTEGEESDQGRPGPDSERPEDDHPHPDGDHEEQDDGGHDKDHEEGDHDGH